VSNILVEKDIVIARPIHVVRAQFADMRHHESNRVHSTLHVTNVRPQAGGGCLFTGRRRVLGIEQEDEIQVTPHSDGHVTLRSIAGSNEGLVITQIFQPEGPDRTRVKTFVDLPLNGALRWIKPLLQLGVERDVMLALQEDRADLEQGGYAPRPVAA
jgi:hypothetical protein